MEMKIWLLFSLLVLPLALADLRFGFYQSTCPQAEKIVFQQVQKKFKIDPTIAPALLRMQFHDCFVHGCDASILIDDPTGKHQAEKDAPPNLTVRGYDLINTIKGALEAACPSKVSCADIIVLATRDAVSLSGGPNYTVPTGRLDGLVSKMNDVNLPGPQNTVPQAFSIFSSKGFSLGEMVTLLGAHTIGVAHCNFFQNRVQQGAFDPTMNSTLAANLSRVCASNRNPTVFLDQGTGFKVDNAFYKQLILKKGILQIDQELTTTASTAPFVSNLAGNGGLFTGRFAAAMVKLGMVIENKGGEVRTKCNAFNTRKTAPKSAPPPQKLNKPTLPFLPFLPRFP